MTLKLFIQLHPSLKQEVIAVVQETYEEGTKGSSVFRVPEEDEDLKDWWIASLTAAERNDCGVLLKILQSRLFGKGALRISESNGESILRACSSLRLRLRREHLKSIPNEILERGEVHVESLPEGERFHFIAYLVLAHLQEKIVEAMDPEIGSSYE